MPRYASEALGLSIEHFAGYAESTSVVSVSTEILTGFFEFLFFVT